MNDNLLLAVLCVVAVAVMLQAGILVAMMIGAAKTQKRVVAVLEHMETRVGPVLDQTRLLLEDTTPKMRVITNNVLEASHILRQQAQNINGTVEEVTMRTRKRVIMLDEMVGAGIVGLERAMHAVQDGIVGPMKQVNGLLAGFRTGMDVLRRTGRKTHAAEDESMFV